MSTTKHPAPPTRIGKTTYRKYQDGSPMVYTVIDEIVHVPPTSPRKAICLHLLKFHDDDRTEMRFCYYVIGHKPRGRGKWLWGQFAPMLKRQEFEFMIQKAKEKGWIS